MKFLCKTERNSVFAEKYSYRQVEIQPIHYHYMNMRVEIP